MTGPVVPVGFRMRLRAGLIRYWVFVVCRVRVGAAMQAAKVLMVGAGGIGCELLKTLALSGFSDIHIVSNLLLASSLFVAARPRGSRVAVLLGSSQAFALHL